MGTVTVQSRVQKEIKDQAEAVFAGMGMSVSDAIRVFLHQSINTGGLPFQPVNKTPNAETIAAFREVEEGNLKRFDTVEELFKSWRTD
jgi:DNA-damage-inducible protein J